MTTNKKDRNTIKKDICHAVMEIIGNEGFAGVTARNIGKFMGLKNVSLVNYYFGSKELIVITLKNNYFNVMSEVYQSLEAHTDPLNKLNSIFNKMLDIFWDYPALINLFYFDEIKRSSNINGDMIKELTHLEQEIVDRNLDVLQKVTGIKDNAQLLIKLFQIRGAVMFPALSKQSHPELQDYFSIPENRNGYVSSIINGLCGKA